MTEPRIIVERLLPRQADKLLADRVADMTADAVEHLPGPIEGRFTRLVCDGCGRIAVLDPERVEMPVDWVATDDGDYCPDCIP